MTEIQKPDDWDICANKEHYFDLIIYGGCRLCDPVEYKIGTMPKPKHKLEEREIDEHDNQEWRIALSRN